jgi:hypothetical protein
VSSWYKISLDVQDGKTIDMKGELVPNEIKKDKYKGAWFFGPNTKRPQKAAFGTYTTL